jgi:hypothetical protein
VYGIVNLGEKCDFALSEHVVQASEGTNGAVDSNRTSEFACSCVSCQTGRGAWIVIIT